MNLRTFARLLPTIALLLTHAEGKAIAAANLFTFFLIRDKDLEKLRNS